MTQLTVDVNVMFVRIDAVDVTAGTWTVRLQTDMYWDQGTCQAYQQLYDLCSQRFGGLFYFGMPQQLQQPLGATLNANMTPSAMMSLDYERGSCLSGDFADTTLKLGHSYAPIYFPFETYMLTFRLTSFSDNQTLSFNVLDGTPPTDFEADLPDNWASMNGLTCKEVPSCVYNPARGGTLCVSEVRCAIVLHATDEGYLLTVCVFWIVTMLANLFSGMGVLAKEGSDGLTSRGVLSASFVLAYVLVVPARPRDLPLTGTGGLPTSTEVFLIGLINLVLCTMWSYAIAAVLRIWERDRATHSSWWHVLVRSDAVATALRVPTAAKHPSAISLGDGQSPAPPAAGRLHVIGSLKKLGAAVAPKPPFTDGAADDALDTGPHSKNELDGRRQAVVLDRLGKLDLAVWLSLNLACIAAGIGVLVVGRQGAAAQVEDYIAELEAM